MEQLDAKKCPEQQFAIKLFEATICIMCKIVTERHFAKFAKKIALSNNLDEIKKKIIIQREVGRVSLTNGDFTLFAGSSFCSSGRSQCVSSSELLRSEEDEKKNEEEGDNKHFTVEINFDEV